MLLAACLVSAVLGMVAGATPEPNRCCFDKEFTAVLGEAGGYTYNGKPYVLDGTVQLGYDFYRKRQGTISTVRKQNSTEYKTTYMLMDYANRMVYMNEGNGLCQATRMNDSEVMLPPCVTDDSRFLGSSVFGYGSETMRVNTWEYRLPNSDVIAKIALNEACIPVVQTQYGHMVGEVLTELSFFYTAYHPGLTNVNDLDPPTNCTFVSSANQNGDVPVGRRSFPFFFLNHKEHHSLSAICFLSYPPLHIFPYLLLILKRLR